MKSANALVLLTIAATAQGELLPTYPLSSASGDPYSTTGWQVDRYAPRRFVNIGAFQNRADVLEMEANQGDGQLVRPPGFQTTFYNSQGRLIGRTGLAAGTAWSGDLFIPQAWSQSTPGSTTLNRRTDLFTFLAPFDSLTTSCPNNDCLVYAGIGFSNADISNQLNGGGPPRIRVFKKSTITDGWINTDTPILYNQWNRFCGVFTGNSIEYYANGNLIFTDSTPVPVDVSQGPPRFVRAINVQNYNFSSTYNSNWSELKVGPRAELALAVSGPTTVFGGQAASITISVQNQSASPAQNVRITSELTGLSFSGIGAPCSAGFPCNLGTIAAGQTVSIGATVTPTTLGNVRASLRVTSSDVDCLPNNDAVQFNLVATSPIAVPTLGATKWLLLGGVLLLGVVAVRRAY
jgi:hypothetical protein